MPFGLLAFENTIVYTGVAVWALREIGMGRRTRDTDQGEGWEETGSPGLVAGVAWQRAFSPRPCWCQAHSSPPLRQPSTPPNVTATNARGRPSRLKTRFPARPSSKAPRTRPSTTPRSTSATTRSRSAAALTGEVARESRRTSWSQPRPSSPLPPPSPRRGADRSHRLRGGSARHRAGLLARILRRLGHERKRQPDHTGRRPPLQLRRRPPAQRTPTCATSASPCRPAC